LISGKQPHYLLPLFPAFALLSAYLIIQLPIEQQYRHWDAILLSLIIILIALLLLISHHWFVKYLAQGMVSINLLTEISLLLLASVLLKWLSAYFDLAYQSLSDYSHYLQLYRSKSVGILDAPFLSSACIKIMLLP